MDNSYCFPSVKTLCKVSGYSKNSVIKYRAELINTGRLGRRSRKTKSGANASNIYTWLSPYLYYIDKRDPTRLRPEVIESLKRRGIDLDVLKRFRDGDPELEAAMETEIENKIKNKTRNKIKRDITKEQSKRLDQVIEATSKLSDYSKQGKEATARRDLRKKLGVTRWHDASGEEAEQAKKEVNAHDVRKAWKEMASLHFGSSPSMNAAWGKKELSLAKKLCDTYGGSVIVDAIEFILSNWDRYKEEYSIDSIPSLPLIYGFRGTWIEAIANGSFGASRKDSVGADDSASKKQAMTTRGEYDGPSGKSAVRRFE